MASNTTTVDVGAFSALRRTSATSETAASRIEWLCRLIHTLARGHVQGRGIVVIACSVTAVSSIMLRSARVNVYNECR